MCTHIHIWEFLFQDFCDSVTVEGHSEGARRSAVENHLKKKQGLNPGDKIHPDNKTELKMHKGSDKKPKQIWRHLLQVVRPWDNVFCNCLEEIYFSVLREFLVTQHFWENSRPHLPWQCICRGSCIPWSHRRDLLFQHTGHLNNKEHRPNILLIMILKKGDFQPLQSHGRLDSEWGQCSTWCPCPGGRSPLCSQCTEHRRCFHHIYR